MDYTFSIILKNSRFEMTKSYHPVKEWPSDQNWLEIEKLVIKDLFIRSEINMHHDWDSWSGWKASPIYAKDHSEAIRNTLSRDMGYQGCTLYTLTKGEEDKSIVGISSNRKTDMDKNNTIKHFGENILQLGCQNPWGIPNEILYTSESQSSLASGYSRHIVRPYRLILEDILCWCCHKHENGYQDNMWVKVFYSLKYESGFGVNVNDMNFWTLVKNNMSVVEALQSKEDSLFFAGIEQ